MQPNAAAPVPVDKIDEQLQAISRRTKRLLIGYVATGVIVAAAIVVVSVVFLLGEATLNSRASCEVNYNHSYAEVQLIRTRLTNDSNQATETLIKTVFTVPPGQSQAQDMARLERAYNAYVAAQNQVAAQRRAHPVPSVPKC